MEVAAAGICASDLHLVAAGPSPITLGHEFAGWAPDGTPVAVLPLVGCEACEHCRSGHPQRCQHQVGVIGVTLDGGMAERVRAPASCLRPLPPRLRPADACLAEPLAVALHGLHRSGVDAGQRVLVVGAGPIGLCAVAAASALGATVDVAELSDDRRDRAVSLGAGRDLADGYDVVVDAAGSAGALRLATRRCAPGGTVALVATHWTPVEVGMDLQIREISLVPAYLYGHHRGRLEFDQAIDLLADTELADVAISHRLPLDRAAAGFELAGAGDEVAKVVLAP